MMRKTFPLILMLAILLLAAAVRLHHLGAQSFWYDEGVAYGHSQRTLAELIPALQRNVHVPAYFGTLALYEDFVGHTEFALRSLSVLFSLLSIAFTYALGKRLFGQAAGLAAAGFVTLNTFSIYYAQETRMYAMMAAVGAASMWVFVGFWKPHPPAPSPLHGDGNMKPLYAMRGGVWGGDIFQYTLALGLVNTLGMYTHVSYALVMLAQGIMAVMWLISDLTLILQKRAQHAGPLQVLMREFIAYVAANVLTIGLFLPWAGTALSQVGSQPNISDVMPVGELLRTIQGWFAFGNTFEDSMGGMGAVVYFLLVFGLVLLPNQKRRAWWGMLLPVIWVLVSVAGYVYLNLYARYLRFLIPAQIAFALWLGRGIQSLWDIKPRQKNQLRYVPKASAVFATLALMLTLANGLAPLYDDAKYQRDDYRGLAQYITDEARRGDAIILSAAGLQEIFGYYYHGDTPVYPLPAGVDTAGDTQRIIREHEHIFVVLYGSAEQDPDGVIEKTLNQATYQISDVWWGDVRLVRYVTPLPLTDLQDVNARFGEHITLKQYALSGDTVQSGDALQLRLEWQTDAVLPTRYKVFVQLLDENGVLAAQRDSEPGGGKSFTTDWKPGETVTDNHALVIPAELPAGDYTLIVGLYDLNDASSRLPVNSETALTIGKITVEN